LIECAVTVLIDSYNLNFAFKMVSLIGRFERDVLFLEQGEQPNEVSGHPVTSLKYEAEEHEKLTDDDIARLASAIRENDKF
jgi:hypothetical protein